MFNNREIATAVWLLLFTIWILTKPGIRKSIGHLFRAFLQWKIVSSVLAMSAYTSGTVAVLWLIGLWTPSLIKESVLWFIFTGFVMLMQFMTDRNNENVFGAVLRDSIKLVIFIEFLIGAYVFPLWIELFFVPTVTFILLLDAFAATDDKYGDVKKLTGCLTATIGIGILVFAATRAVGDWQNLGTLDTLRSIAFPPLMSIAFIPFVYTSMLIAAYENLFIRLNIGQDKPNDVKRYAKSRILKHCGLSLRKLRELSSQSFRLISVQTADDVDRLFQQNPEIIG